MAAAKKVLPIAFMVFPVLLLKLFVRARGRGGHLSRSLVLKV
jgi:hypothetical protein